MLYIIYLKSHRYTIVHQPVILVKELTRVIVYSQLVECRLKSSLENCLHPTSSALISSTLGVGVFT